MHMSGYAHVHLCVRTMCSLVHPSSCKCLPPLCTRHARSALPCACPSLSLSLPRCWCVFFLPWSASRSLSLCLGVCLASFCLKFRACCLSWPWFAVLAVLALQYWYTGTFRDKNDIAHGASSLHILAHKVRCLHLTLATQDKHGKAHQASFTQLTEATRDKTYISHGYLYTSYASHTGHK